MLFLYFCISVFLVKIFYQEAIMHKMIQCFILALLPSLK
jgi:hypothetical protein